TSKLSLSSDKLFSLHQMLDLQSVAKEAGYLEYVRATTNNNIEIRYFEDGLFILESTSRNPELTTKILKTYHDNSFIPALRYLFSQDVPMPGLQNHTLTNHPVVVALTSTRPREFEVDPAFGAITSQITSDDVTVFKTQSHIFIVSARRGQSSIRDMVEMQVFFREFQNQLEYFHTFQRKSWNRVNTIGNRELIKPAELMQLQNQLSAYQKSIKLAEGRLEQMDAYIQTRAGIAEQLDLSDHLLLLFHYRFEALEDTYHYLLHSWKMTRQLADQTSNTLANLQSKSTQSILSSMRLSIAVLTMVALSAIFTREISILSN